MLETDILKLNKNVVEFFRKELVADIDIIRAIENEKLDFVNKDTSIDFLTKRLAFWRENNLIQTKHNDINLIINYFGNEKIESIVFESYCHLFYVSLKDGKQAVVGRMDMTLDANIFANEKDMENDIHLEDVCISSDYLVNG